jgi:hypothetical protein
MYQDGELVDGDVTGDLVEFMLFDHSEIADYVRM